MSEIQAGDGWRLIDKHTDKPREGDQYLYWNKWRYRPNPLAPWDFTHTYRRRIPAKPEAMEIDGHLVSLEWGFVRIGSLFSHYYFSSRTEAIRKLGEWLISVADWREAQDAAK